MRMMHGSLPHDRLYDDRSASLGLDDQRSPPLALEPSSPKKRIRLVRML